MSALVNIVAFTCPPSYPCHHEGHRLLSLCAPSLWHTENHCSVTGGVDGCYSWPQGHINGEFTTATSHHGTWTCCAVVIILLVEYLHMLRVSVVTCLDDGRVIVCSVLEEVWSQQVMVLRIFYFYSNVCGMRLEVCLDNILPQLMVILQTLLYYNCVYSCCHHATVPLPSCESHHVFIM